MSEPILFFSDLHCHTLGGDWRRVEDALAVLDWIFSEAQTRQIKKVWFLGDFFHVRGYMYPTVVARTYRSLLRFRDAGIEVTLLVGNHDMPKKNTTKDNCLTAFSSICNVIEQPTVYETEDWNFYWLPYVESVDKTNWAIENILKEVDPTKKSCLLAHLDIHGALFHTGVESTNGITARELSSKFDLVLTGHYHTHQRLLNNIWYIGSPYQQNFGEANEEKGFMVFENGRVEFVENTFSPKYMYITSKDINDSITNNYVSITIADSNNIVPVREAAANFNPRNVNIKIDRVEQEEERQLVTIKTDARDVGALLKEWVNKTANPSIFNTEHLLNYGLSIVSEKEEE